MEIKELSDRELTEIYEQHMKVDFPAAELKPLARILDMRERGLCRVYGWMQQEQILAYAILVQPELREPFGQDSYVLMDYYAVCRGHRGQGVGSRFLAELLPSVDCLGILFEVEDPAAAEEETEREIRERRIRFYHRLGLRETQGLYTCVFGVEFKMLAWNRRQEALPATEMKAAMSRVYRMMLPEELYVKNIQLEVQA